MVEEHAQHSRRSWSSFQAPGRANEAVDQDAADIHSRHVAGASAIAGADDPRPIGVRQHEVVVDRQEAWRCWSLAIGQGTFGYVEQFASTLVTERPQTLTEATEGLRPTADTRPG